MKNISYGKEDATLEDVVQACKAANIHEAIMQMPQGYEDSSYWRWFWTF